MWVLKTKKRKTKSIKKWGTFDNFLIAKTALDALKAGFGSKFIRQNFTYLRIEKNDN